MKEVTDDMIQYWAKPFRALPESEDNIKILQSHICEKICRFLGLNITQNSDIFQIRDREEMLPNKNIKCVVGMYHSYTKNGRLKNIRMIFLHIFRPDHYIPIERK